jgi:hypothetical protein
VKLDPTASNKVVRIGVITSVAVNVPISDSEAISTSA